ncbi:MAG: hypothetical protein ACI89X_003185 [Planctomycetota bacterium]|jgi:hypothetical protein
MSTRFFTGAFGAALLATVLTAQTPPCISANDTTNNTTGAISSTPFGGGNGHGWQFTPTQTVVLFSAEIITENQFVSNRGFMSLEIWDTNFIFQPGQRLGGGTFEIDPSLPLEWHGANFDIPVVLNAGQTYWFVWIEPGGSELPIEPGGITATYVRRSGAGWATQATSTAPKWRGYCSQLDSAAVAPVGFGCPTSAGTLPGMMTNYEPTVGNTDFQLEASGFLPGTVGLMILGTNPGWVSLPVPGAPGCSLVTDALVTLTVTTGTGNEASSQQPIGPGFAGHCVFPFAIPANALLSGTVIGSQFAMLDLAIGTPLPLVFSNGLQWTIQ